MCNYVGNQIRSLDFTKTNLIVLMIDSEMTTVVINKRRHTLMARLTRLAVSTLKPLKVHHLAGGSTLQDRHIAHYTTL